ncbi:MAG TPA: DUF3828 domain-containing protein [Terracidiphilus sp.]|nr:DUF3828 domain-containing protein [Terracidiphilus sp.]
MRAKSVRLVALLVAAIFLCGISHAQDAASAKAFLTSIYHHYENGGEGIDFDGPHANLYFDSSLLALEKADVKANGPGYAPAIDWDPICGCQDFAGIWNLAMDIKIESSQRAKANVSFSVFDPKDQPDEKPTKLVISLVVEHGAWRIYDILDESDPKFTSSVRKLLTNDIASLHKNAEPPSH